MKKIVFGLPGLSETSGITKVVVNIAKELKKEGYNVSIVGCHATPKSKKGIDLSAEGILVESANNHRGYISRLTMIFNIHKYLKRTQPDIFVVSGVFAVLPIQAACLFLKKKPKLYIWEHTCFFHGPKFHLDYLGRRFACHHWDGIINITKKDNGLYRAYCADAPLYQIYNLTHYPDVDFTYDAESKKIITAGYLSEIKGFDMLVEVAAKVLAKHPDWTWDLYGEGNYRPTLEKLIQDFRVEGRLTLKGYCADMPKAYAESAIYVMTSRKEGMGMVLVEAQKYGLPCVAFDIPCGPSDTIFDGVNGLLVEPFDLEEMAAKIESLIEDKEKRIAFSAQSMLAHGEMTRDFIVNKWKQILQ